VESGSPCPFRSYVFPIAGKGWTMSQELVSWLDSFIARLDSARFDQFFNELSSCFCLFY
jgi:hypothetical protein